MIKLACLDGPFLDRRVEEIYHPFVSLGSYGFANRCADEVGGQG